MATVLASEAGFRSGVMRIPVPSRMRDVTVAMAVSSVSGSGHGSSGAKGNSP